MKGYADIANSGILWAITAIALAILFFQVFSFLKQSVKAGRALGITDETMKTAFKTGLVAAIGPSILVAIGMVSLLVVVGGPTALMRESYIGAISYELLAVQFAAKAYGLSAGDPNLPAEVFSVTLWCMALGCCGWIIVTAVFTDKMEKLKAKIEKGGSRAGLVPAVSIGAMLGAYGYLIAGYAISLDRNTVALLVGFSVMLTITVIYKKKKIKWLNEWGLTLAMVSGLIIAGII